SRQSAAQAARPSGSAETCRPCKGEMLHTFGNDEREAAEHDRDVMMPSGVRTALEVIEPELALQLFMNALRAPTLLPDAHDLLLAQATWQRREGELCRLVLAFGPLHHEPYGLV